MRGHTVILCALSILIGCMAVPYDARALTANISKTPEYPAPGETVFISVSALEFNAALSDISWKLDGKPLVSGVGKTTVSVTAPAAGKKALVSATIKPNIGGELERSIEISPAGVDLLWEATDSYVPAFYRGKALPIKEGQVKVVAVPNVATANGALRSSGAFAYTWRKDGKNVPNQSGLGKAALSFSNQILDKENRVEVAATDGSSSVGGTIIIRPFTPEVILYKEEAARGPVRARALRAVEEVDVSRVTVIAEPYFLSKNFMTNPDITGKWTLNGQEAKSSRKNALLINTGSTTGNVSVAFSYADARKLFRNFTKSFTLNIK